MAKKVTRRTFVGTSIHLAVVAPVIHLEPIEAAQPSARFPAVERRMLWAAIDVIIPAEGRMPAATAVGGLDYVERMAAADGTLRELLIAGLRALDSHSRTASGQAFVDSRPAEQTAAIAHTEKTDSPPGFFGALRDAVFEAYYTQPEIWTSVVNPWNQAHDVPNLFIVDGSSFTTSGAVNPTSTIGALALRAADGIWSRRGDWK